MWTFQELTVVREPYNSWLLVLPVIQQIVCLDSGMHGAHVISNVEVAKCIESERCWLKPIEEALASIQASSKSTHAMSMIVRPMMMTAS